MKLKPSGYRTAAPELLVALEKCEALISERYHSVGTDGYWPTITPIIAEAKAAIAKAKP